MAINEVKAFEIWQYVGESVGIRIANVVTTIVRNKQYTDKRKLVADALRIVANEIENKEP